MVMHSNRGQRLLRGLVLVDGYKFALGVENQVLTRNKLYVVASTLLRNLVDTGTGIIGGDVGVDCCRIKPGRQALAHGGIYVLPLARLSEVYHGAVGQRYLILVIISAEGKYVVINDLADEGNSFSEMKESSFSSQPVAAKHITVNRNKGSKLSIFFILVIGLISC